MADREHPGYRHLFGPVPSRRLGISLGVDLFQEKTCTLDCVYCECGRTTSLTLKRKEYTPTEQIKAELADFLSGNPQLDYITFSGSGEPTLHTGLGEIVRFIKYEHPRYKVALLTNGTLFFKPLVREEISDVDVVKVSLDAVSEKNFSLINRPHPRLKLSTIINGLITFGKQSDRQIWVEVFLLPGYNDSEIELKKTKEVLGLIKPYKIQLNTLDRPGTERWTKPVETAALKKIAAYLYDAEIIKDAEVRQNKHAFKEDLYQHLLSTLKRRPCTAEDVSRSLGIQINDVPGYLEALIEKGEIEKKQMPRGVFYMKSAKPNFSL